MSGQGKYTCVCLYVSHSFLRVAPPDLEIFWQILSQDRAKGEGDVGSHGHPE